MRTEGQKQRDREERARQKRLEKMEMLNLVDYMEIVMQDYLELNYNLFDYEIKYKIILETLKGQKIRFEKDYYYYVLNSKYSQVAKKAIKFYECTHSKQPTYGDLNECADTSCFTKDLYNGCENEKTKNNNEIKWLLLANLFK